MPQDKDFDSKYGIDPRQKSNIRRNSNNAPEGIDWDVLMNTAMNQKPHPEQTDLGFINRQNERRETNERNSF